VAVDPARPVMGVTDDEMLLLRRAVEACGDDLSLCIHNNGSDSQVTAMDDVGRITRGRGSTLAVALTILIADLGR
jgi:hypothetical protein